MKLTITITKENNTFFADCEDLSIYTIGTTISNALIEFTLVYTELQAYYSKLPYKRTTGLGTKLKKAFEELQDNEE